MGQNGGEGLIQVQLHLYVLEAKLPADNIKNASNRSVDVYLFFGKVSLPAELPEAVNDLGSPVHLDTHLVDYLKQVLLGNLLPFFNHHF